MQRTAAHEGPRPFPEGPFPCTDQPQPPPHWHGPPDWQPHEQPGPHWQPEALGVGVSVMVPPGVGGTRTSPPLDALGGRRINGARTRTPRACMCSEAPPTRGYAPSTWSAVCSSSACSPVTRKTTRLATETAWSAKRS